MSLSVKVYLLLHLPAPLLRQEVLSNVTSPWLVTETLARCLFHTLRSPHRSPLYYSNMWEVLQCNQKKGEVCRFFHQRCCNNLSCKAASHKFSMGNKTRLKWNGILKNRYHTSKVWWHHVWFVRKIPQLRKLLRWFAVKSAATHLWEIKGLPANMTSFIDHLPQMCNPSWTLW